MRHIDLFSGIGGFAYAAKMVWKEEYHNVLFCDNNEFCQQVIRKNFGKDVLIYGDIRTVTRERVLADTAGVGCDRNDQKSNMERQVTEIQEQSGGGWASCVEGCSGWDYTVLTGGFPCQPFSCAGNQRGKEDNRYLWHEMFRVIKEFKPDWIVGENVAGIISMAQQQGEFALEDEADTEKDGNEYSESDGILCEILDNIAGIGYTIQTFVIPACAVNAPHRRDRIWIVANREQISQDSFSVRSGWRCEDRRQVLESKSTETEVERPDSEGWEKSWIEVAQRFCRMDDGLPANVDGFKLSKSKHRVERLKALGNSIVPQVVVEIFKAIKAVI